MSDFQYSIRSIRKEDVIEAANLWYDTGMIISLLSIYSWLEVDPEGFKIAVTDSGEIIGVCAAVIHHSDLAMVGMYVVKKSYQGKGVGFKVWNAAMEHIGQRNACLYSVLHLKEKYQDKGGFSIPENDWTCMVYLAKSPVNPEALSYALPDGVTVDLFEENHLSLIFEFDYSLIGYKRNMAVELNCKEEDSQTLVAFKDGLCVGYGTIKSYGTDAVIVGPLYANEPIVAEVMLRKLILLSPKGKRFAMMTFSDNTIASDFMNRIGCDLKSQSYPLYKKRKIFVDHSKLFAMFHCHFSPQ